jgi:hypothetical protein
MNSIQKLLTQRRPATLRILSASGQLGYGIPEPALQAGIARRPDFIGCDMGSVDPGPAYLGSGEMATSPAVTRKDLTLVLKAARLLDVPLVLGTAGTSGAAPHLDATLDMIRAIARDEGLHFRMASIRADIAKSRVTKALEANELAALGGRLPVSRADIESCTNIVGQMGCEPFRRAFALDADVVVAGRACDTAIFASIPQALGFSMANVMHMAKIVECTSICCEPGGRDAMLATLDADGFELESMNPERRATPLSVAAHGLYEQTDPLTFTEPDGTLDIRHATYTPIDERRTRVSGATWHEAERCTIKVEGSAPIGHRAVLVAATADPRVIERIRTLVDDVEKTTRRLVPGNYQLHPRLYGLDGVVALGKAEPAPQPRELGIIVEVVAASADLAMAAAKTFKQFLLHAGFPGRLSTGGNIAFPFTPPELAAGAAYRYALYHVMPADDARDLFPVFVENV